MTLHKTSPGTDNTTAPARDGSRKGKGVSRSSFQKGERVASAEAVLFIRKTKPFSETSQQTITSWYLELGHVTLLARRLR